MSEFKIARNPGYGMGEAALEIVKQLEQFEWKPAEKDEKIVKSEYYIPIRFKLTD